MIRKEKRIMKKLFALLLALALVLAMSAPAFADGETYELTITGTLNHTYNCAE